MPPTPVDVVNISQPEDVPAASSHGAKISEFEDLASYNWLDEPDPTILVPGNSHIFQKSFLLSSRLMLILVQGIPPTWNPPGVAPHLKTDSGAYYIDQNEDRNPRSLLEPLILAVVHMRPHIDLTLVDIVTDRRPIHLLHAFLNGKADDFEFKAEVVNDTVLFARKEVQSRQMGEPGRFTGYRHAFEEEYTTLKGCAKGSTSHHRIVRYKFGGFRFLVRSSVDAYLETLTETAGKSASVEPLDDNDIAKYMKSASLAGGGPKLQTSKAPVTIVDGGENIPHGALLELKTRFKFSTNPFDIEDKIFDLWMSQTPNFLLASYQNAGPKRYGRHSLSQPRLGEFVDFDIKPMPDVLREWESKNEVILRRLAILLREVVHAVKRIRAPCVVRCKPEAGLQVLRAGDEARPLLPEDLYKVWVDLADWESRTREELEW